MGRWERRVMDEVDTCRRIVEKIGKLANRLRWSGVASGTKSVVAGNIKFLLSELKREFYDIENIIESDLLGSMAKERVEKMAKEMLENWRTELYDIRELNDVLLVDDSQSESEIVERLNSFRPYTRDRLIGAVLYKLKKDGKEY